MYYFDSYEEFEKFGKSPDYLEGMGDVLSVKCTLQRVPYSRLHSIQERKRYERYDVQILYESIKDVSKNLEQDIGKTVPSETWDDTMATLENQLFGLLDGYFEIR